MSNLCCSPSRVEKYKGKRKPVCGGGSGCLYCREKYDRVNEVYREREISLLVDDRFFSMTHINTIIKAAERDGVTSEKIRFTFIPRYDLSANPWELYATYFAGKLK